MGSWFTHDTRILGSAAGAARTLLFCVWAAGVPLSGQASGALGAATQSAHTGAGTLPAGGGAAQGGCEAGDPECAAQRDPHTAALVFGFFFHLPHYLIEDEVEYLHEDQFLRYPYEGGVEGYMVPPVYRARRIVPPSTDAGDLLIGAGAPTVVLPYRTRPLSLRLAADHTFDLDAVHKTSAYLLLESRWRWGVESGFSYLRGGDLDRSEAARLFSGDANIVFRFAQEQYIQMRTGAGIRYQIDPLGGALGVNFTYGVDFYPAAPLIFSVSVDFGNLGSAFVLHGRGTVGAVMRSLELFAGWDVLQMGDTLIHGPLAGVRAWI